MIAVENISDDLLCLFHPERHNPVAYLGLPKIPRAELVEGQHSNRQSQAQPDDSQNDDDRDVEQPFPVSDKPVHGHVYAPLGVTLGLTKAARKTDSLCEAIAFGFALSMRSLSASLSMHCLRYFILFFFNVLPINSFQ
jgi:hypothetical protein